MKTLIKSTWLIVSLLMSFNSPELNGQTVNFPFMRFSGIDRWEGLTSSTGNGGAVTYSYSSWKTNDSVMFDSIMFYMRGSSLHGFDADSNKYYYLVNGVKKLYLDFSLPSGSTFTSYLGGNALVNVSGGGITRKFTTHYGSWPSYDLKLTYLKDQGLIDYVTEITQGSNWSKFTTTTLSQLWVGVDGVAHYLAHGYKPTISFTPLVSPSRTYRAVFSVTSGHTLQDLLQQYPPQFSYLDSLFLEYYYSNGQDSTDLNTVPAKVLAYNWLVVNFDSTIIQNGYHIKYRLKVRDLSMNPKYAFSPADQSFYTLHIDPTVGIEDEAVPDNFFQIAAYPNPFNNSTTLQIDHFESGEVTVNIYSLTGEKAMEPVLIHKEAGTLTLPIEFKSQPSGIYLADINFVSSSGKMIRKHQKLVYLK
jgi:hypothetical protein